ncbi:hypothetical protein GYMLUDRAFT_47191 [Collybiopsis luxurians FD-317 M1]|uniref:DEK C-terminal domain-containing protein n=1 Tax=Collybiopsis luxurians FD-317 M1 TaxID=944289 RepID=A0A0D0C2A0_9AGAR|nr:hypothetical protein GYMLUDRAFT_47191 [Collybiopsis luxurians FD-317 M1]
MSIPKPKVIEEMTRKMILDAAKTGALSKLSPKIIREKLEQELGLEDRALRPQKDLIEGAVKEAMDEIRRSEIDEEDKMDESEPETKKPVSKEKKKKPVEKPVTKKESEVSVKGRKRKSETVITEPSSKKPKSSTKTKKDKKGFTSAEVVPPSSDFEDEEPAKPFKKELSSPEQTTPKKPTLKKPSSSPNVSKPASSSKSKPPPVESPPIPAAEPENSESELTELTDESEPPKPKKKGKAKESAQPRERKKKAASASTLSKDEETIKKLKALINACGVRKVWSRLFKDIQDSPSQQIALLRKTLAELGMTGRLSMEQARAIKEKRELESELGERIIF